MTAEMLASIVGVILSLVFGYVPGVEEWYNAFAPKQKAAIMGILLILVSVAVFGLGCGKIITVGVSCDQQGALALLQILIAALIANQSTYVLAVRPAQKEKLPKYA